MYRLLVSLFLLCPLPVAAQTQGYVADFILPATLVNIDTASGSVPPEYAGCASSPPNAVFGVAFTAGLAYGDDVADTLYGLEWNGGAGPDIYLYTMAASGCATGSRVGSDPVGFPDLESLAFCPDGALYTQTFDFGTHLGRLIRIDPLTGLGTAIGASMPFDVRILGMACDDAGTLWAVTAGHGSLATELYTVNPNTGVATLVGATGTGPTTLESLALEGTTLAAAGTSLYHLDPNTGVATLEGGSYDTVWAMAHRIPEPRAAVGWISAACALSFLSRRRRSPVPGP